MGHEEEDMDPTDRFIDRLERAQLEPDVRVEPRTDGAVDTDARERWQRTPRATAQGRPTAADTARRQTLVASLFERSWSQEAIAKELGVTRRTVREDEAALGLDRSRVKARRPKVEARLNERRAEVARLYTEEQFGVGEVAKRLGVAESTVRNDLAAMHIPLRSAPVVPIAGALGNALTHMSGMSDVVLQQDLSVVRLDEEQRATVEAMCKNIAKAVSYVRRSMKGSQP